MGQGQGRVDETKCGWRCHKWASEMEHGQGRVSGTRHCHGECAYKAKGE